MPDIQLRFHKDVLVLSTPLDITLERNGFEPEDRDYALFCEPEIVDESFRFEEWASTPVFVIPTEGITNARLLHSRFEGNGEELATQCIQAAQLHHPQHILAAVGPSGLPLDESSVTSLKQSRKQYEDVVRIFAKQPVDGVYFCGFSNPFDAQCALVGARAVYDGVVAVSFLVNRDGTLPFRDWTLEEAVRLADENGADVIGIITDAPLLILRQLVDKLRHATEKPLLVEIVVNEVNRRQMCPTDENPYPTADSIVDAGLALRALGVQFIRAAGKATPAYTGSLVAILSGLEVVPGEEL